MSLNSGMSARKPLWQLLMIGFVAAACLVAVFSWPHRPILPVPIPHDLERLEPQLRAYIQEKLEWVREAPRDASRRATLGTVYGANGLWGEARAAFEDAERLDPSEPLAGLYVAIATRELGDLAEAVKLFRQETVRFQKFAPGYYHLGDGLVRAGLAPEAERAFQRMIELAPNEWRGFAGLGEARLRQGKYGEAVELLRRAIQIDPTAKNAHYLLGLALRGMGRMDEAARELRRGENALHYPMPDAWSVTAPQHMRLLQDLYEAADDYAGAGQPAKAVELLESAFSYHSNNPGMMLRLAIAYNKAGAPQKGRELLLKIIAMDNHHLPAYVALAASCAAMGLNDEALAYADQAVKLGPKLAEPYLARANVLLTLGRDAEALSALQEAARCDPRNAQLRIEMGDVSLRNLNRATEALGYYEQALQLDPDSVPALVRLADMHLRQKEPREASEALERVRVLAPDEPVIAVLEKRLRKLENK